MPLKMNHKVDITAAITDMRFLCVIALSFLTACAMAPTPSDTGMSTSSRFEPSRFAGAWHVVAALGATEISEISYRVENDGAIVWRIENSVGDDLPQSEQGQEHRFRHNGFGVLEGGDGSGRYADDQLIHWVDEDFQTAVVGYASRAQAWILNRTPALRDDRLKAAEDILEFNGYDLSKLELK